MQAHLDNINMSTILSPQSRWRHTNGNLYTVLCVANEFTERPEQYPPTVVYQGDNGRIWSRPVSDWSRSMTLVNEVAAFRVAQPLLSREEHAALADMTFGHDHPV